MNSCWHELQGGPRTEIAAQRAHYLCESILWSREYHVFYIDASTAGAPGLDADYPFLSNWEIFSLEMYQGARPVQSP